MKAVKQSFSRAAFRIVLEAGKRCKNQISRSEYRYAAQTVDAVPTDGSRYVAQIP
jgi:hypothetical protein